MKGSVRREARQMDEQTKVNQPRIHFPAYHACTFCGHPVFSGLLSHILLPSFWGEEGSREREGGEGRRVGYGRRWSK